MSGAPRAPRASRPGRWAQGCALGGLAVALLFYATALHGPGIGHDSVQYLAAADGLREGAGFLRDDGTLYDIWAPLQPVLLALPLELGATPLAAALIVNAISFAALVVLASRMAAAIASGAGWIAAAGLLVSLDLLWIEAQLLSEPAFLALAAAAVAATERHARRPTARRLAAVVACAALAACQRYVGVTLIASTALALLLRPRADALRVRAARAALFAFLAGLPLGLWMLRNLALTGTPTGPDRGEWGTGLGALWFLRRAGLVASEWLLPGARWAGPRPALLALAALLLAAVAVRARALPIARRGPGLAALLFVLVYGAFLGIFHANVDEDGVGVRELVPLLPFLWILLAGGGMSLVRAAGRRSRGEGRLAAGVLAALLGLHLSASVQAMAARLPRMRAEVFPSAYNLPMFDDDELWAAVRARSGAGPILSNDPELVYFRTRLRNRPCGADPKEVRSIARGLAAAGASGTLVWFPHNRRDVLPRELLERHLALELLASTPKGFLYAFGPRAGADGGAE